MIAAVTEPVPVTQVNVAALIVIGLAVLPSVRVSVTQLLLNH